MDRPRPDHRGRGQRVLVDPDQRAERIAANEEFASWWRTTKREQGAGGSVPGPDAPGGLPDGWLVRDRTDAPGGAHQYLVEMPASGRWGIVEHSPRSGLTELRASAASLLDLHDMTRVERRWVFSRQVLRYLLTRPHDGDLRGWADLAVYLRATGTPDGSDELAAVFALAGEEFDTFDESGDESDGDERYHVSAAGGVEVLVRNETVSAIFLTVHGTGEMTAYPLLDALLPDLSATSTRKDVRDLLGEPSRSAAAFDLYELANRFVHFEYGDDGLRLITVMARDPLADRA